jgi:hypothetical protein
MRFKFSIPGHLSSGVQGGATGAVNGGHRGADLQQTQHSFRRILPACAADGVPGFEDFKASKDCCLEILLASETTIWTRCKKVLDFLRLHLTCCRP